MDLANASISLFFGGQQVRETTPRLVQAFSVVAESLLLHVEFAYWAFLKGLHGVDVSSFSIFPVNLLE